MTSSGPDAAVDTTGHEAKRLLAVVGTQRMDVPS
jgi:hypothetical protein